MDTVINHFWLYELDTVFNHEMYIKYNCKTKT